jgi:hypothetical protein
MPVPQWRAHRRDQGASYIRHRQSRSMALGPAMRIQFEDATTIRYQIQEVLRAEGRLHSEHVQEEIETYAQLMPASGQWRATLQIEIPDARQRQLELPHLNHAVHHLHVESAGGLRLEVGTNEDLPDRHLTRPSAVHFLRFQLSPQFREEVARGEGLVLACRHPSYPWAAAFPAALLAQLVEDERLASFASNVNAKENH